MGIHEFLSAGLCFLCFGRIPEFFVNYTKIFINKRIFLRE